MNIAAWCIRNNRSTLVVLLLLIFLGMTTYLKIPRLEDPEFTVRVALVITPFPGASPQRVEELITDKLEEKIREIPELDDITSHSMSGLSIIHVNIQQRYTNCRAKRMHTEAGTRSVPCGRCACRLSDLLPPCESARKAIMK